MSEDKILSGSGSVRLLLPSTNTDDDTSSSTYYWYKNGQELADFANQSTLDVNDDIDNLIGVYQCFRKTASGMVLTNVWRVFKYCKYS